MSNDTVILDNIRSYTQYLKLPTVKKYFAEEAKEAVTDNISYVNIF